MPRCDHCGNECSLPLTCQHCGGKYCTDCRLPPAHECAGIQSWKNKPAPGVGLNYGKSGVTVTGGGYIPTRAASKKKTGEGVPWLRVMVAVIAVIVLGVAYLVLSSAAGH